MHNQLIPGQSAGNTALASKTSEAERCQAAFTYVLEHIGDEISLSDLALSVGLSRYNFCRKFQKIYGIPPMRWLWIFRAVLAAEFIKIDPEWSLTDVAFTVGFSSSAHFSRVFKQFLGETPSQFRKKARAENRPPQTERPSGLPLVERLPSGDARHLVQHSMHLALAAHIA